MKSVFSKNLEWVLKQKYVTLVECEPGGTDIVIMIEKPTSPVRFRSDAYVPLAVVVTCSELEFKVNGKRTGRDELGAEIYEHLISICEEAAQVINIGDTYFSDPGAEV